MIKRFTLLLAFLLTFHVTGVLAQQKSPLEREVTITFNAEKADGVLLKLGERAQVNFSYNPSIFDLKEDLNGSFQNKTVREILNTLFPGQLQYKEKGNYIIITRSEMAKSEKKQPPLIITGYIIDSGSGEKISEASVYDKRTFSAAVSNQYGFFKLEIDKPEDQNQISVSKKGYQDKVVIVDKGSQEFLSILIQSERNTALDNVGAVSDVSADLSDQIQETSVRERDINMENIKDTLYRKYQISVVPFVGTNAQLSGNVVNEYSFNVFGGYSMGTSKFEIGGFFNINRSDMNGVQLAGYFNYAGGNVTGFQAAGFANVVRGKQNAWQLAGYTNVNFDSASKPQFAGLLNANLRYSKGFHMAGLVNAHLGNYQGTAVSGLLNVNFRKSNGAMVTGLANIQLGEYKGFQASGLTNINWGKMEGVQLSSLLNISGKLKGAQIGLVNIADSVSGVQIGFISFSRAGYHKIEISADEVFYTNLAFRTGSSNAFYNIFTAGIKPQGGEPFWTYGYGVGTSPRLAQWLFLNLDLTANQVSKGAPSNEFSLLSKLNLGLEFQPFKKISIGVGATLNSYLTKNTYPDYPYLFTDYEPKMILDENYSQDLNHKMWMGWKLSLRFL